MPGHRDIKSQHRHLGDGMVVVFPPSWGYSLYIVLFLVFDSNYVSLMLTRVAFVIVTGVILSICAALPWTLHWQGPALCDD
ncbi:hypothetical protein BD769DRAFT_1490728, partial [Suillus cothurnatus]